METPTHRPGLILNKADSGRTVTLALAPIFSQLVCCHSYTISSHRLLDGGPEHKTWPQAVLGQSPPSACLVTSDRGELGRAS